MGNRPLGEMAENQLIHIFAELQHFCHMQAFLSLIGANFIHECADRC